MYLTPLLIGALSLFYVSGTNTHCPDSNKGDFPSKEYDVRPNIFIDRDHLLGRTKVTSEEKIVFSYGNGPYGPSHWNKLFPKCAGRKQSPINIDLGNLRRTTYPKLVWGAQYEKVPTEMSVTNNGHTIVLKAKYAKGEMPTVGGGPLEQTYTFQQIHFHWASMDHKGSEHTVNKKRFPMEMHVVHYRTDLNKTTAASAQKGLCIVGYIFEIDDKCHDALSSILSVSEQLKMEENRPIELTSFFKLDSLLDLFTGEYVTYEGSLTTPPCYESAIWILSPYTVTLSKKQLEKFRSISRSSKGFGDNYRATQPLNNRVVNFAN